MNPPLNTCGNCDSFPNCQKKDNELDVNDFCVCGGWVRGYRGIGRPPELR